MEERRRSKVSSQQLRSSIRETGVRETAVRETGFLETGVRETGVRETGVRETEFGHKSISRLKLRRTSFGFSSVPGIKPVDRTSQVGIEYRRPPLAYLNTYQLDPSKKFDNHRVEVEVNKILDDTFTGHKYSEQGGGTSPDERAVLVQQKLYERCYDLRHLFNLKESPALAIRIAGEVMRKIKNLNFNRYRIITVVTIAQKRAQSYNNAISILWDYERDSYVDVIREVTTAFLQVTAFGIYLD